jgi:hypothetical protein
MLRKMANLHQAYEEGSAATVNDLHGTNDNGKANLHGRGNVFFFSIPNATGGARSNKHRHLPKNQ